MPEPIRPQPSTPTFLICISLLKFLTTKDTKDHEGLFLQFVFASANPYEVLSCIAVPYTMFCQECACPINAKHLIYICRTKRLSQFAVGNHFANAANSVALNHTP